MAKSSLFLEQQSKRIGKLDYLLELGWSPNEAEEGPVPAAYRSIL